MLRIPSTGLENAWMLLKSRRFKADTCQTSANLNNHQYNATKSLDRRFERNTNREQRMTHGEENALYAKRRQAIPWKELLKCKRRNTLTVVS